MGPHRQNCRPWSLCSWRRIFVAGTNLTCLHLIPRNCSDTTGLWRSPGAEWGERGVRGEGGIDLTIPRLTTMSWLHQTLSDIRVSNTRVQLLVTSSSHLLYIACFSFHNKILHQWSYFVVSLTIIFIQRWQWTKKIRSTCSDGLNTMVRSWQFSIRWENIYSL